MTLGIDGIASGMDTTAVIRALMQIEAAPQVRLKQQSSEASKLVTAFQSLNTKLAALATSAGDLGKASNWSLHSATSSHDAVTATATTEAAVSSLDFRVDAVAKRQVTVVDAATLAAIDLTGEQEFTLKRGGDSTSFTVAAGGSVQDLAAAINAQELGVTASAIRISEGNYLLQVTGGEGEANAFELHHGGGKIGTDSQTAEDAKITLYGESVTSGTNTFSGVLQGVDFTISAAAVGQNVTLNIGADVEGTQEQAQVLVDSLKSIFSQISAATSTTTSTDSSGNTTVSGGLFTGETTVRFLDSNLRSAVSAPIDGVSPSQYGISFDRYGALSLDTEKFGAAMAADPEGTQAALATIANRVAEVSEEYSDSYDGLLTQRIKSEESTISRLGDQIAQWDNRLATREATLFRTFTAMEVALSKLQTQQQYLTQQLDSMNASK